MATTRFTANVDSPMIWLCPSTATAPLAAASWMPTTASSSTIVTIER